MHEYGHYVDSQILGITYLINIGVPSLISAATSSSEEHDYRWYELNANKNAERYFNRHYGNRVDWKNKHERKYPRKKQ